MSEALSIEFALHGKVEGVEITPRTIVLSQFNEFNQQVETFIGGSQRLKLDQVHVEITQGSYVLRVILPVVVFSSLEPDLRLMTRQDVLGELDFKRAEVVQKWQARTKNNPDLIYEVRPKGRVCPGCELAGRRTTNRPTTRKRSTASRPRARQHGQMCPTPRNGSGK